MALKKDFISDCISGLTKPEQFADYIVEWREMYYNQARTCTLMEHLGMTEEEFYKCLDGNDLRMLEDSRRMFQKLDTTIESIMNSRREMSASDVIELPKETGRTNSLESFIRRLKRIGIDVTFVGNYPWVYLDTVNGNKVKGAFQGDHGFTAFWLTRPNEPDMYRITDITEVFKKIRETINRQ